MKLTNPPVIEKASFVFNIFKIQLLFYIIIFGDNISPIQYFADYTSLLFIDS